MKKTTRDNWRVIAVVRPQRTEMSIASLGFKDAWGEPLEGQVWGGPFEIPVLPKRLGDVGMGISMSDSLASRDIEGDYRRRCEVLRDGLLRHPNVVEARIECDEEHRCSFCGLEWSELKLHELEEFGEDDGLSIVGEPACCDAAVAEFRRERGIAQCST